MGSRARAKVAAKAAEVKDAGTRLADNDHVREIVTSAREFATSVSDAAKGLIETTEKATEKGSRRSRRKPRGRLRKLMRFSVFVAAVAAVASSRKVRETVTGRVRKLRGTSEPQPWTPSESRPNGEVRTEPAPSSTPAT